MKRYGRVLTAVTLLAFACAVPNLLLAAAANGSVPSVDGIPRPPGAIDGRGWELVSPPDKNRNAVLEGGAVASTDGNRVLFGIFGGVPQAPTGGRPKLLATRTAAGWSTKSPMPPRTEMLADSYAVVSYAPDLSAWIASAQDSLGSTDLSPDVSLVRLSEDGAQTPLHTFPVYFGASGIETVASDDLSHVFADVPEPIDSSHVPGTGNIYDFGSGTPLLVSRMPGTDQAPSCGVLQGVEFANNFPGQTSQNWVSVDGSRAFFLSRGDDTPACDDSLRLYLRDTRGTAAFGDDATTAVTEAPLPGDPEMGVEAFLQATPDGSAAFFRTATSYDPADDLDGSATDLDVYRWTESGGNVCVTCAAPAAGALPGVASAAISQDGSHVYFTSAAQLAAGAPSASEAAPNIYVVDGGEIRYVATTDEGGVTDQPRLGGALTPDGNVLVFWSANPALDALSGLVNNELPQYYRYDDRDGSLICISCRPGGATRSTPPSIAASNQSVPARIRVMSDDGGTIFFPTNEALVAADVNTGRDIYEWHDGDVGLITSGEKQYTLFAQPSLYTTTASGRDVFFRDNAKLTPEVQDDAFQLYDARVGGGFPTSQVSTPPCSGEACQGLPAGAPPSVSPPSATFVGPRRVKARRRHPRGRRHSHLKHRGYDKHAHHHQGTRR